MEGKNSDIRLKCAIPNSLFESILNDVTSHFVFVDDHHKWEVTIERLGPIEVRISEGQFLISGEFDLGVRDISSGKESSGISMRARVGIEMSVLPKLDPDWSIRTETRILDMTLLDRAALNVKGISVPLGWSLRVLLGWSKGRVAQMIDERIRTSRFFYDRLNSALQGLYDPAKVTLSEGHVRVHPGEIWSHSPTLEENVLILYLRSNPTIDVFMGSCPFHGEYLPPMLQSWEPYGSQDSMSSHIRLNLTATYCWLECRLSEEFEKLGIHFCGKSWRATDVQISYVDHGVLRLSFQLSSVGKVAIDMHPFLSQASSNSDEGGIRITNPKLKIVLGNRVSLPQCIARWILNKYVKPTIEAVNIAARLRDMLLDINEQYSELKVEGGLSFKAHLNDIRAEELSIHRDGIYVLVCCTGMINIV